MNRKGYCLTHHCIVRPKRELLPQKFGKIEGQEGVLVTSRRESPSRYACRKRVNITIPQVSDVPVMKGSVINTNSESRSHPKPGQAENILTGIVGASNHGFESETLLGQVGLTDDRELMGATGD